MPFNFLKKSRHYNVTSKSLFVISVHHLLDTSTTVDCTLSSESTGQECLDNVCQRLSIGQPEFFGLRYIVKGTKDELRWIELERPLSKQLEKYAAGPKLFLRVMYYVMSGVTLFHDEVSRYYYFLQLKSDVVDGKISCDVKQAVILALYCQKAECDSYQKDKHTIDYFKTLLPFPKQFIEDGLQERLTEEVLQQSPGQQNLTQSAAEELYIAACQQLDGYGQEKFIARDNAGNEVQLCLTVNGIAVWYTDTIKFYPWHEVSNVVNLKRTFNIECTSTVSFTFPDAETGRYFWKLCVLQHTFYMKYEKNQSQNGQQNLFQNTSDEFHESREDILSEQVMTYQASEPHIITTNILNNNSVVSSNVSLAISQQQQQLQQQQQQQALKQNKNWPSHQKDLNLIGNNFLHGNDAIDNQIQSTSCLDLSNNNNNFNQERERLKALLPTYRTAPDYETAVQQKYHASSNDIHNGVCGEETFNHYLQYKYPDVTQTAATTIHGPISTNLYTNMDLAQRLPLTMRLKPPPPYPANRLSSTSTPDLAVASHRTLLGYRGSYVSGSSPDLVSTRTFLNPSYIHYPYLATMGHSQPYLPHGTFENLNMIEEQPSIVLPLRHQHLKKPNYDQQIYRNQQYHETNGSLQKSNQNGSIEPIYENVPLPWQGQEQNNEMRNRTSSIQSAPGGMRNDNKINPSNEHDIQNTQNKINLIPQTEKINQNMLNTITTCTRVNTSENQKVIMNSKKKSTNNNKNLDSPNPSHSQSILNSSQNSAISATTTDSGISSTGKEKRKKKWGILSRYRSSSTEKQKSATLGREKSKNKEKVDRNNQEANLRHRWSTGLPKLQPLSATFSKDKLCQILYSKLNDSQLFLEFERIPKRRESARYECALLPENKSKNSDPNFLPYDDNRVRITPTMDNKLGYVNASHITATVGTNQRFYIIAQSPHSPHTLNIFWQCIWEADVYLVVQLSEEFSYIPPNTNKSLEYGQFQIYQEFSQTTDRCITSKLRIFHIPSRRYRSVWHLNYFEWAEQNCPKDDGCFLDFLEELNSVRLASINEVPPGHNTNPPVLIHCSEGGGRSGVTLAADLLLYTLDHNQDLDIPRVVGQLRQQRDNIIPSLAQYKFIYALLITYLKRTRLI